jgi:hypothetical protein
MARRRSSQLLFSLFMFQDIITCVTGIMILITLILGLEFISRVSASPAAQTVQQSSDTRISIDELNRELLAAEAQLRTTRVSAEDLPSLDPDQLKRRADDLAAESDGLEAEITTKSDALHKKEISLAKVKTDAAKDEEKAIDDEESLEREIADAESKLKDIEGGKQIFFKSGVHGKATWLIEITDTGYRIALIGVVEPPKSMLMAELIKWVGTLDKNSNAFLLVLKPKGKSAFERCRSLLADTADGGFGFDVGVHVVAEDQTVLDPETGAGHK